MDTKDAQKIIKKWTKVNNLNPDNFTFDMKVLSTHDRPASKFLFVYNKSFPQAFMKSSATISELTLNSELALEVSPLSGVVFTLIDKFKNLKSSYTSLSLLVVDLTVPKAEPQQLTPPSSKISQSAADDYLSYDFWGTDGGKGTD